MRCLVPHGDSAEHFPGQNRRSCENGEFGLKEPFQKKSLWVKLWVKMAALQACCKAWDEKRLELESPKGNGGEKTSKPIIHYCGFLQLKMQISHVLDQEASEDGSKADIRKVHAQS